MPADPDPDLAARAPRSLLIHGVAARVAGLLPLLVLLWLAVAWALAEVAS